MRLLVTLIDVVCYAMFVAILVRVAFSWIEPYPRNRVYRLAYDVTEPVLAPVRRVLPMGAGLDFSPMIVSLVLLFIPSLLGRF